MKWMNYKWQRHAQTWTNSRIYCLAKPIISHYFTFIWDASSATVIVTEAFSLLIASNIIRVLCWDNPQTPPTVRDKTDTVSACMLGIYKVKEMLIGSKSRSIIMQKQIIAAETNRFSIVIFKWRNNYVTLQPTRINDILFNTIYNLPFTSDYKLNVAQIINIYMHITEDHLGKVENPNSVFSTFVLGDFNFPILTGTLWPLVMKKSYPSSKLSMSPACRSLLIHLLIKRETSSTLF